MVHTNDLQDHALSYIYVTILIGNDIGIDHVYIDTHTFHGGGR